MAIPPPVSVTYRTAVPPTSSGNKVSFRDRASCSSCGGLWRKGWLVIRELLSRHSATCFWVRDLYFWTGFVRHTSHFEREERLPTYRVCRRDWPPLHVGRHFRAQQKLRCPHVLRRAHVDAEQTRPAIYDAWILPVRVCSALYAEGVDGTRTAPAKNTVE